MKPGAIQCSVKDCRKMARARGMCMRHYQIWYRNAGEPSKAGHKRKRRSDSLDGLFCACGAAAKSRWGRGGEPMCLPCYRSRWKRL